MDSGSLQNVRGVSRKIWGLANMMCDGSKLLRFTVLGLVTLKLCDFKGLSWLVAVP